MSDYTLKLDLDEYQRGVLITLLQTEIQRGERDETTTSSWHQACKSIAEEIIGYREAIEQAKAIAAADEAAACRGLAADEGPDHLPGCVTEGGITECADGCPRFAAVRDACE